jgi:hypothetical protein
MGTVSWFRDLSIERVEPRDPALSREGVRCRKYVELNPEALEA